MQANKKPLIIVASIIGTIALLVILTPPVTSMLLTHALYEAGADQVELGDVDINPLVGTARVHDLVVRKDGSRVLALDFGYINLRILSLFSKKLEIDQVVLKQGYVDLHESEPGVFGIRGLQFPSEPDTKPKSSPSEPSQWTFGIHEVDIESTILNLEAIKATSIISADKLLINKVYSWDKDGISELVLDGRFNEGRFSLNTRLSPLAKLPKVTGRLQLEAINLADIHPWIADQVDGLEGLVNLDSTIDIARQSGTDWSIQLAPSLNTLGLKIKHTDLELDSQSIVYRGEPTLSISNTEEALAVAVSDQGQLSVQKTMANIAQHSINTEKLDWTGAYSISIPGDDSAPEINASGDVQVLNVSAFGPGNVTLAAIGTTDLSGIDYQFPMSVDAQTAILRDAQLLQSDNKNPVISWNEVNINGISVSPALAHLQEVAINQLGVRVQRTQDGSLYLPLGKTDEEARSTAKTTSDQASEAQGSAGMGIRIDKLNIAKGSLVEINDTSVNPAYKASVVFNQFAIQNINSGNINQATSVDINATINRYAQVSTKGYIKPFMKIPDTQLKTSISGVNLTRISPYSKMYSGYQINNGSLNLESDLKIQSNKIDETVKLKLSNLDLEVADAEKASETDAKLAIGLPSALNMLKDSNDDIKLNLPIKGDLSDPNFDFSHAITVVMSKALTKGATAYAAYALQPWGAALLVKDVAGKMVTQVTLDPIVFEPSVKELPEQAPLYLEKIAGLMNNRPGIELKICARATEADRLVIARKILEEKKYLKKDEPTPEQAREVVQDTVLLELAEERMFTIKDVLIEQHKIKQDRLQTCLPKLDSNAAAKPSVDLQI